MNTDTSVCRRHRARGASLVTVLLSVAIIVALAAAAWFLILRPHHQAMLASRPAVKTGKNTAAKSAPPPANVAAMSTAQLLSEASKAIKDQRLLAPKGNNAFEFYLKVLDRQPDNQVAKDALRETFPFAANAAEQVINQGDFAEAGREIALLAKADPDNYTLTILRSKLDARRKVRVEQQQAQELAEQQQEAAAAARAKALQEQAAKQKQEQAAAAKAQQQQQAARVAAQQKTKPKPTPPPAQPKVTIQNAVLVKQVNPRYPPLAARMRRQGWVEVQFTVTADGDVTDAHVVASDPDHVFDRAAVSAISRWKFKPALRNGKPMAVTMRRRVEFKLSGG